jgi:glycosyltransferase involved in cell wall biosynthesis
LDNVHAAGSRQAAERQLHAASPFGRNGICMKFVLFANTDWYLYNFRLSTALQLKAQGHDVVMLSPPGTYGQRFSGHGLRWQPIDMDRAGLNPVRESLALQRLVRILRNERPHLLHSFTVKCAVYGALAARLSGVPAVVNAVAGMGYVFTSECARARALRPLVRGLMRSTLGAGNARLILQNPDDAHAFESSGMVPAAKIRVIRGSGVDTSRFSPAHRSAQRQPLRVLLAARLLWAKGIAEYVAAAAALRAQGRDIQFLLAGTPDPGNPDSVRQEQAEAWAREGTVEWLGHVEDMPALLSTVDVFALPSFYREGVPKGLLEAAACGLALVTTDLAGCREIVARDGVDGLHVQPHDAQSLAAALSRLDDDRALLRLLGDNARRKVMEEFEERSVIARTFDVYNELVAAHGMRV